MKSGFTKSSLIVGNDELLLNGRNYDQLLDCKMKSIELSDMWWHYINF